MPLARDERGVLAEHQGPDAHPIPEGQGPVGSANARPVPGSQSNKRVDPCWPVIIRQGGEITGIHGLQFCPLREVHAHSAADRSFEQLVVVADDGNKVTSQVLARHCAHGVGADQSATCWAAASAAMTPSP